MHQYKMADLTTINNGAAVELFEKELEKVLQNIMDINTQPDAVREVRITCKIIPTKDRASATTTVSVQSKLANREPHESVFFLGRKDGIVRAFLSNVRQAEMPFGESKVPVEKIV